PREIFANISAAVADIIAQVRQGGDTALCEFTRRFDRMAIMPAQLRVTADEIEAATASVPTPLLAALDLAADRIEAFHRAQLPTDFSLNAAAGLTLGLRWT